MTSEKTAAIKGGEFLIRETLAGEIFIPEEFNEEQKMIQQQCKDFLDKEILNRLNEIDSMKKLVMVQVLELGEKRTRAYLYQICIESEWENFDFSHKG